MSPIVPYLVYPGTCKAALQFYASVFGGAIESLQTFAESPMDVPAECGDRVFNAEFRAGDLRLKASDDLPAHPVTMGSHVSLYVAFPSRQARDEVYRRLAADGRVMFPPDGEFSMLADRFGVQWMLVSA